MTTLITVFAVLFGAVMGSFANALAYRFPRGESLMTRSHCTSCNTEIKGYNNIPVLTWFILSGKCAHCKAPYSFRYPFVEALTALVFGVVVYHAIHTTSSILSATLLSIAYMAFVFIGVVLALIDLDEHKLPTKLIYGGSAVVVPFMAVVAFIESDPMAIVWGLLGALIYSASLFVIWLAKPAAMGFGDVRLALLLGFMAAYDSLANVILSFFLPFLIAMIFYIPRFFKKNKPSSEVPFGPWMLITSVVILLWGDILISTYLHAGGIH